MVATAKKSRRRQLIAVKTYVTGAGDDRKYDATFELPMSGADKVDSENAAARIMGSVNAQLDFAESDFRLVMYDIKKKTWVKVEFSD